MNNKNEFEKIKEETESYWETHKINNKIYGFQFSKGTKWKPGLSDEEILSFEKEMGFAFPDILKDYYSVMNGTIQKQINVYGQSGEPSAISSQLYSYPENIADIKDKINWIMTDNGVTEELIEKDNISRIFPIHGHRFLLIDHPGNPILSMYGTDIIEWAESIIDLFKIDLLGQANKKDFKIFKDVIFWGR